MTKLPAQTQAEFCSTLVDEWARAGVRSAVVSPGSRSAPMALALFSDGRVDVRVRLDERAAAYMALGMGLASGVPAVVLTTSGTAAAEIHPAVVEAHLSRVPLIVCTADRPPELQGVGAPQTIDQHGLYGSSVRFSLEAAVPHEGGRSTWRSLGSRIVAEALAGPAGPGPVHVNLAFREPLLAPPGAPIEIPAGRDDERPWHGVTPGRRLPAARQLEELAPLLAAGRRGVIVAGARCGDPAAVLSVAARLGWPLLADPRSGCRLAPSSGAVVVAAADALLRDERFRAASCPEVVLRLGEPWASKLLAGWFAETAAKGAAHVVTDPDWAWRDPGREAAVVVACDPDELLSALLDRDKIALTARDVDPGSVAAVPGPVAAGHDASRPAGEWAGSWASGEGAAQQAIDAVLEAGDELTEPFIARHVSGFAGVGTIVVASSMPVRDLEWFGRSVERPPRILSNRGANGIDGVASTTLGVAAAATASSSVTSGGEVTLGLLGDLAFLHDLTAFVRPDEDSGSPPCVFVVVDNHGGGIFSFLAQAAELDEERFERLFGTPQHPDVAGVARGLGAEVVEAGTKSGFEEALAQAVRRATAGGRRQDPVVVVARTDRRRNVEIHAELNAAVSTRLADGGLT